MRTELDKYVIERVKFWRKKRAMSQLDLAYALNHSSASTIAKIESPNPTYQNTYNLHQINAIALIFDIGLFDLLPTQPIKEE